MLKLRSRTLLNNGISIVELSDLANRIIQTGESPSHIRTKKCEATDNYKLKYGIDLSHELTDSEVHPEIKIQNEEKIELIKKILESPRHNHTSQIAIDRLDHELNFFYESNNIEFLCVVDRLITRFKNDGVVWGCGRGSSCASYTLYLLEVHDVNPIKYKIEFKEFSKE